MVTSTHENRETLATGTPARSKHRSLHLAKARVNWVQTSFLELGWRFAPSVWWSRDTIPSRVQSVAFKLFIFYIRNPYVPDEPLERKILRLQLSATSLIGFGALREVFLHSRKRT